MTPVIRKIVKKIFPVAICTVAVLLVLLPSKCYAKDADGDLVIVSMGDSYSSGEGNEPFYGQTFSRVEQAQRDDWTSHRSTVSWPGRLKFSTLDGTLSSHYADTEGDNSGNWYFVAASGAQSFNITSEALSSEDSNYEDKDTRQMKYTLIAGIDKDEVSVDENDRTHTSLLPGCLVVEHTLPYQIDIFEKIKAEGKTADYVTVSIGGNDVGFADIVSNGAISGLETKSNGVISWLETNSTYGNFRSYITYRNFRSYIITRSTVPETIYSTLREYLSSNGIGITKVENVSGTDYSYAILGETFDGKLYNRLKNTYRSIIQSSGNTDLRIIVLGYPRLIDEEEKLLFYSGDSQAINKACEIFDVWLDGAVAQINEELKEEFGENGWTGSLYYSSVLDEFGTDHLAGADDGWLHYIEFSKGEDLLGTKNSDKLLTTAVDTLKSLLISQYCVHPNEKGLEAYARCAQETINDVERSVRGTVTDDSGVALKGAVVRVYKTEAMEVETTKNSFSFTEQFFRFFYSYFNNDSFSEGDIYSGGDADEETNLLAEGVTDENGEYNIYLLPELENDERFLIKVSAGGYFDISYYTTQAKRKVDCTSEDKEIINKDGEQKNSHIEDECFYYFKFEMEKKDVEKLLCGKWQSNSLHWSLASYMEIRKDGTCSLDYMDMYEWKIDGNMITFTDTVGAGYKASYPFEVTNDVLIIYDTDGDAFIDNIDEGDKAVYYKR